MAGGGIIQKVETGDYVVSFTPPQFKDFLSSLTASSREEKTSINIGFDLSKSNLQTFLDRIDYQVSTQNDVVSKEHVFTFNIPDGREITSHGYASFFGVDDTSSEIADRLQVDITYMIGFSRGGEKKYERQVISIEFKARPIGLVTTRIMSTEITWPPTVFQLIEREVRGLAPANSKSVSDEHFAFRWAISAMMKAPEESEDGDDSKAPSREKNNVRRMIGYILPISMMIQLLMMLVVTEQKTMHPMYNEKENIFERGKFNEYVELLGLDEAVSHAQKSKILFDMGYAKLAPGDGALGVTLKAIIGIMPIWGAIVALIIGGMVLYCRRMSKHYEILSRGRIFVGNNIPHDREKVSTLSGAVEAIIYSILAAMTLTLWQGFSKYLAY